MGRMLTRAVLAAAGLLLAGACLAQSPALVAAAQREGSLLLYSSMAEKDLRALVRDFEERYRIKVQVWRSGKTNVLQRAVSEVQSGHEQPDVIQNPAPEMEALRREKGLATIDSPVFARLIPAAAPAHHQWAGARIYLFVQAFNTQRVKRDELPRSFDDLLDPRWKDRITIEGKAEEWFYTVVHAMGEERGLAFFRKLAATNGLSVRMGNALVDNMVASGEVPFTLAIYSYLPEQSKKAGAPVDWIALQPTVAATDAIGIAVRAPHPNAARLFFEYVFGAGQPVMARMNAILTTRAAAAAIDRFHPVFVDPAAIVSGYARWTRLFEDTVRGRNP